MSIAVFLADDHTIVRDGLRFLLDAEDDIEVVGDAATGRQAVQEIDVLQPDVALLDIAMPELNGIEAARQIRERCPQTRVIILSMYSSREHIARALQVGALGYLLKESAGAEVVTAVRTVQTGGRYLSHKVSQIVIDEYIHGHSATGVVDPLGELTGREREILHLVAEGRSSLEVGEILALSPKTVETYRSRLMGKLGITDLPSLVKFAIRRGIISLE